MAGKKIFEIKTARYLSRQTLAAISLIFTQISRSRIEEDILHAFDMYMMALKSSFRTDETFLIACVSHDIERSLPCRLRPENFKTYDEFKSKHQFKSAVILEKILKNLSFPKDFINRAVFLVGYHETGAENVRELEELVYLDVLSFLNVNSLFYLKREGPKKLLERMTWGLKRLTPENLDRIKSEVKINDCTVRKVFFQAIEKM